MKIRSGQFPLKTEVSSQMQPTKPAARHQNKAKIEK